MTITVQLAGGWRDAWEHEPRGPHGEWIGAGGHLETVVDEKKMPGSHGGATLLTYSDGSRSVKKTGSKEAMDREQLAAAVAQAVGAPVPQIERVGPGEIRQEFIDGQSGEAWLAANKRDPDAMYRLSQTQAGKRIGVLDYLTRNIDRAGNWKVDKQGKPVAYDNGAAFSAHSWMGGGFASVEGPDISEAEAAALRPELEALKPQFTQAGHADWYAGVMGQLAKLEPDGGFHLAGDQITAADILTEWHATTGLAAPHLNRAAAALHAGDRARAAGELELAASYRRGQDGERLCRMAIDLVGAEGSMTLICEQVLDLASRAHDTASATARRTASEHARDAWHHEIRAPDGRWITGADRNDVLTKAATGRAARAVRLHDVVLYGKTEPDPSGFGFQQRLVPMEVTGLHHHFEGSGKTPSGKSRRHRYTDMDLTDPETGEVHHESLKDGTSVKLYPREHVKAMGGSRPQAKTPVDGHADFWAKVNKTPSAPAPAAVPAAAAPPYPGAPQVSQRALDEARRVVDPAGMSVSEQDMVTRELARNYDLMPSMIGQVKTLRLDPSISSWASGISTPAEGIRLAPSTVHNVAAIQRDYQKREADGFYVHGDSENTESPAAGLRHTITHEFGHAVTWAQDNGKLEVSPAVQRAMATAISGQDFPDTKAGTRAAWAVLNDKRKTTRAVSGYGSRNWGELAAEAYAAWAMGDQGKAGTVGKAFVDLLPGGGVPPTHCAGLPAPEKPPGPPRTSAPIATVPAPHAPSAAPPAGKPLTGKDLWLSGEGITPGVTEQEARAAQAVWYNNLFSYSNNYLRNGTLPSASMKAAISDWHAQGFTGQGRFALPTFASNDADYIKGIDTFKGMIARAPKFSRPAVMYRDVTGPDQVFGPVGSMKGRVFSDPGFMSATANPDSAERYGHEDEPGIVADKIIMNIPAGGGGMRSQAKFSPDHAREQEFTFAPGTRWRVDDDQIVNGRRQTTVTQIVPPGTKPGPKPAPFVPKTRVKESWEGAGAGYLINEETGEYVRDAAGGFVRGPVLGPPPTPKPGAGAGLDPSTEAGQRLTAPVKAEKGIDIRPAAATPSSFSPAEKKRLSDLWAHATRYTASYHDTDNPGSQQEGDAFAHELHRLLTTNTPPATDDAGTRDAHAFLAMVEQNATRQDDEIDRGIDLDPGVAEGMFKPGATIDLPVASWSTLLSKAHQFMRMSYTPGQTRVLLHTAPGAKGMNLTHDFTEYGVTKKNKEAEVVTGGRYSVDSIEQVGTTMNVYLTQQDFSAH